MKCNVRVCVAAALICAVLSTAGPAAFADLVIDLGRGPITVYVPDSYDPEVPMPLIFALHGYGGNGAGQNYYYGFLPLSEEYGFLYCFPDGTVDLSGTRFWNATDACCNFDNSGVDDSGYLMALVMAIRAQLNVDPQRIHFAGLSNGGFMSYRMACEHADVVASIVSQAGATWYNPDYCAPETPVHVLQIHGTADNVIFYNGGYIYGVPYPGAVASVEQWAAFGGCDIIGIQIGSMIDLDASIPGADTEVYRYDTDCDPDGSAELWKILGGSHVPPLTEDFAPLVIEWLLAHPKSSVSGVEDALVAAPAGAVLLSASPNPFNPQATISFSLARDERAKIAVYDLTGRLVNDLANRPYTTGTHSVVWNGKDAIGRTVPSGAYIVRLSTESGVESRKISLIR